MTFDSNRTAASSRINTYLCPSSTPPGYQIRRASGQNYRAPGALDAPFYEEWLREAPLFGKGEVERLRAEGVGPEEVPVVVGGVIPDDDAAKLIEAGVARVYTPKDYDITAIMRDIVAVVDGSNKEAA